LPAVNTNGDPSHRGSVGRLLPAYELDIRHPGAEGSGEIWLRGPGTFDAYFSPWSLRSDEHPDGWFKTGDVGHLDRDGYLWVDGRDGFVINFAGMKVFPEEVEAVLLEHPAIADALVYAAPHATFGQIPRARVVLREGAAFDPEDVRRFGYKALAPHKVPKEFEVVDRLERTASGKLRRTIP
jgi:long-chain acyl-CoA synthetase